MCKRRISYENKTMKKEENETSYLCKCNCMTSSSVIITLEDNKEL